MWQGGLAAGKPSVPWYQIHVRGIPGWRACRRPQARPPRFVQGNNGERSLDPAPGEAAAMQRPHVSAPPSTVNADHRPDASTRVRTRRPRGAMPVSRTLSPKIGLGPRKARIVFAAGSDVCGMRSREALHRSAVRRAKQLRKDFAPAATCSINRTLTLPGHEEGAKEAFEGPGFRRRAQSGVVPWTERTRRF